jgi:hypothetical protein
MQKIDPSKFAKIINEGNIILVPTNRCWGRPPYIGKIRSIGSDDTLVDLG